MSSIEPVVKYAYDPTGSSAENRIVEERKSIELGGNRTFVPSAGPFFTETLSIFKVGSVEPMVRGVDYEARYIYEEATLATSRSVSIAIALLDTAFEGDVVYSYNVPGGVFTSSARAVVDIINQIQYNYENVEYAKLTGLPSAFPPQSHTHPASEITNTEDVVMAINNLAERLQDSILIDLRPVSREIDRAVSREGNIQRDPDQGTFNVGTYTGEVTAIIAGTRAREATFALRVRIINNMEITEQWIMGKELPNSDAITKGAIQSIGVPVYSELYRNSEGRICITLGEETTQWTNATVIIDDITWDVVDELYQRIPVRWSKLDSNILKTRLPSQSEHILSVSIDNTTKAYGFSNGIVPETDLLADLDANNPLHSMPATAFGSLSEPTLFDVEIQQWFGWEANGQYFTTIRLASVPENMYTAVSNSELEWILRLPTKSSFAYSGLPVILGDGSVAWTFQSESLCDWYYGEFGRSIVQTIDILEITKENFDSIVTDEELTPYILQQDPIWNTAWDTVASTLYETTWSTEVPTVWSTDVTAEFETSFETSYNTSILTEQQTIYEVGVAIDTKWITDAQHTTEWTTESVTNVDDTRTTDATTSQVTQITTNFTEGTSWISTWTTEWDSSHNTAKTTSKSTAEGRSKTTSWNTTKTRTTTYNTSKTTHLRWGGSYQGSRTTTWSTSHVTSYAGGTSRTTNYSINTTTSWSTNYSTTASLSQETSVTTSIGTAWMTGYTTTWGTAKDTIRGTSKSTAEGRSRATSKNTTTTWNTSQSTTKRTGSRWAGSWHHWNTTYSTVWATARATATAYTTAWNISTTTSWNTTASTQVDTSTLYDVETALGTDVSRVTDVVTSWSTSVVTDINFEQLTDVTTSLVTTSEWLTSQQTFASESVTVDLVTSQETAIPMSKETLTSWVGGVNTAATTTRTTSTLVEGLTAVETSVGITDDITRETHWQTASGSVWIETSRDTSFDVNTTWATETSRSTYVGSNVFVDTLFNTTTGALTAKTKLTDYTTSWSRDTTTTVGTTKSTDVDYTRTTVTGWNSSRLTEVITTTETSVEVSVEATTIWSTEWETSNTTEQKERVTSVVESSSFTTEWNTERGGVVERSRQTTVSWLTQSDVDPTTVIETGFTTETVWSETDRTLTQTGTTITTEWETRVLTSHDNDVTWTTSLDTERDTSIASSVLTEAVTSRSTNWTNN